MAKPGKKHPRSELEAEVEPSGPEAEPDAVTAFLVRSRPFLPFVVLLGAALLGFLRGPGAALLTLASGVLILAISMLWGSLRVLVGDAPVDPALLVRGMVVGAPSAEDEQKRAVLRALKDLDLQHSLGQLTEEDYEELRGQYRREATRLLRHMDEVLAPARKKAEALIEAHLAAGPAPDEKPRGKKRKRREQDEAADVEGKPGPSGDTPEERPAQTNAEPAPASESMRAIRSEPSRAPEGARSEEPPRPPSLRPPLVSLVSAQSMDMSDVLTVRSRLCGECATSNDQDAWFCKKCGSRLAEPIAP